MSYLEIYNNVGYDLLDSDPSKRQLEDLQKVKIQRDTEGKIKFSNLKVFRVEKEEDMLNLLFIGDTNRVICETPLNDVSTRSHCVFTIYSNIFVDEESLTIFLAISKLLLCIIIITITIIRNLS